MGWKLTGLAIDKNFENEITELLTLLELTDFDLKKETTFECETSEMLENDTIAIGFFGNGTFLSTGIELMTNDTLLKSASSNISILAFYINDTTTTYCFDYYSQGGYLRRKWISYSDKNIDSSENFGELLVSEQKDNDDLEVIFKQIGLLLNKDFYEIEEEAQMFRFIQNKSNTLSPTKSQSTSFWKRLFR